MGHLGGHSPLYGVYSPAVTPRLWYQSQNFVQTLDLFRKKRTIAGEFLTEADGGGGEVPGPVPPAGGQGGALQVEPGGAGEPGAGGRTGEHAVMGGNRNILFFVIS